MILNRGVGVGGYLSPHISKTTPKNPKKIFIDNKSNVLYIQCMEKIPTDITDILTKPIDTIALPTKKEVDMDKAGAGRMDSYKALARGLKARKSIVLKDGSVLEEDDIPTQIRAAEIISGMNGDKKPEVVVDSRTVTISIGGSKKQMEDLLSMVVDVKEQLSSLKASGRQTGEVIDVVGVERT